MRSARQFIVVCVLMAGGCASVVSKAVTPKSIGNAIQVSHHEHGGVRAATLSPDSKRGRNLAEWLSKKHLAEWLSKKHLAEWLSKKRVADDDYKSYVPGLVVTGETFQLNLHDNRVIFSWRNPRFRETSTQQSRKASDEDLKLRRDLLSWLQNEPAAEFRPSGPTDGHARSQE